MDAGISNMNITNGNILPIIDRAFFFILQMYI